VCMVAELAEEKPAMGGSMGGGMGGMRGMGSMGGMDM